MIKSNGDGTFKIFVAKRIGQKVLHRKKKAFIGNREEAKTEERRLEEELESLKKESSSLTSIKYIRDALAFYKNRKGEIPVKDQSTFNRLLNDLGHKEINLSWHALDTFVKHHQDDKALSPATINRHIQMLKAAVHSCRKNKSGDDGKGLIPENYLEDFPLLPENNVEYLVLWNEELDTFWGALDDRLKAFVYFSWCVPVREGEALNIRRSQVDIFSKSISFDYGFQKNGDQRKVAIPEGLTPYVLKFISSPAEYLFNRGEAAGYEPLGYLDQSTGKISFTLRSAWDGACKAVEKPGYNRHKMRQQAVMTLWSEGWSKEEIMLFGGWKSEEAFDHYFDKETAFRIRKGGLRLDTTWKSRLSNWFIGKPVPKFSEFVSPKCVPASDLLSGTP
jgi:integrase